MVRSSMASRSRRRSVRWSARVGSVSSTYRFWTAGRRMTWRPTPTVEALGRVTSGGTSSPRSRVALTRQASRQPSPTCSSEKVRRSWRVTGALPDVTRTRHLRQVPWPPHVESMAMPFHDAASKTDTPGGTRTVRFAGVKVSWTRPVPSWVSSLEPAVGGGSRRPSRRIPSTTSSNGAPGPRSPLTPFRRRRPAPPGGTGAWRSTTSPTRRCRGGGRRPAPRRRRAACGRP